MGNESGCQACCNKAQEAQEESTVPAAVKRIAANPLTFASASNIEERRGANDEEQILAHHVSTGRGGVLTCQAGPSKDVEASRGFVEEGFESKPDDDQKELESPRTKRFFCDLTRKGEGEKLGLDVDCRDEFSYLIVVRVKNGLVADWNMRNPMQKVEVDDLILDINGIEGATQILEEINTATRMVMTISKASKR